MPPESIWGNATIPRIVVNYWDYKAVHSTVLLIATINIFGLKALAKASILFTLNPFSGRMIPIV
jgi:hypothetical protein